MSIAAKVPRFRPRFSLRLLLAIVTLAARAFGSWRTFSHERPVTVRETGGVKIGRTTIEVRLRLGSPHRTINDEPFVTHWGFDYAGSEERPFGYFNVELRDGKVTKVAEMSYVSGPYTEGS
jgi:hypothetical protein